MHYMRIFARAVSLRVFGRVNKFEVIEINNLTIGFEHMYIL